MKRRQFLATLLASGTAPALSWADAGSPAFLAAAKEPDGTFALFGLSEAGDDRFRIPLPERGHAAAAHPTAPEAVAFARRPGTFAIVLNCATGAVAHRLHAPEGRHFYGHGAFIEGGDILVTTENDIATGEGRLGLWSREDGYARIGEVASGGIGPHDILRLPGDVLAVANGGILTDLDREKLNIDTMRPNLTYLTVGQGIEEVVELDPDLHKASIRHLAAQDGTVAFAMQWEGDLPDPVPLLGLHRRGAEPVLCTAGLTEQLAMNGYAGSVAIANAEIGITSPRGGRIHIFGLEGDFRRAILRDDVCGIAGKGTGMIATDGLGGIMELAANEAHLIRSAPRSFDNHVIEVRG